MVVSKNLRVDDENISWKYIAASDADRILLFRGKSFNLEISTEIIDEQKVAIYKIFET